MAAPLLRLTELHFAYAPTPVLQGVSLDMQADEVVVVVGPSGCGKTTLLRLIAGLERPAKGTIELAGQVLSTASSHVPPEQRPVGMVFQGLALFPHMTVARNVAFGLAHLGRKEREAAVLRELELVGISELAARYPHELSGGQQQRVAIARSLVRRPKLLLMDEPFSDLDAATRERVRAEVLRILREHRTAAMIVSHDREDATAMQARTVTMEQGRITDQQTAAAG